jgi:hypothetical protein
MCAIVFIFLTLKNKNSSCDVRDMRVNPQKRSSEKTYSNALRAANRCLNTNPSGHIGEQVRVELLSHLYFFGEKKLCDIKKASKKSTKAKK